MSANRATNQRLGFHRWLASLKREAPSAPRVTDAPLSAPPPAASTPPPAQPGVSAAPPPHAKRDDDATRVHHIPKEIIYHLRARAASKDPQDERTQVFRAPPELLARARAEGASEPPNEALEAPSDGVLEEHGFGETLEARSGVSLRRQEPPSSVQPPEMLREVEELCEAEELREVEELHEAEELREAEEPLEDATVSLPADAPVLSQVAASASGSETRLERLSEAPSFRQPVGAKLWVAVLMVAVAVLLAWSAR